MKGGWGGALIFSHPKQSSCLESGNHWLAPFTSANQEQKCHSVKKKDWGHQWCGRQTSPVTARPPRVPLLFPWVSALYEGTPSTSYVSRSDLFLSPSNGPHTKKRPCAETHRWTTFTGKAAFVLLLAEGPQLYSHLLFCKKVVSISGAKNEAPVDCR